MKQRTIKKEVSLKGIGLHTGEKCKMILKPATSNTGIVFKREKEDRVISANVENVNGVLRGTTISKDSLTFHTIEHLLSVLFVFGIDNLVVEMSSSEPPICDGSAECFVKLVEEAGIEELDEEKKFFSLERSIEYEKGDVRIIYLPHNDFIVSCTIDYKHPFVGTQYFSLKITPENFKKEIAPARTFCFDYEVEHLHAKGLAKGGSLENAVIIGEDGIHNPPLKFKDEFVRHKILDLLGDLCLLGMPIKGHIIAFKCGHLHNINFAKKLKESVSCVKEEKSPFKILDVNEIQKIIPHRPPFLLVDKVVVYDEKRATGFKTVNINEEFFRGHFPSRPVMPGVLIVEAMAQTACVLFMSRPDLSHKTPYFMGIDGVKFRKPVFPGDVLKMEVEVIRPRIRGGKVFGKASVGDTLVCEAEIMFSLVD
ncbi:MAG: 3-hydroxyacyl-[acyl-carrier-protein] dehydratase FabZ [Caldiserica bacterium]|nr:MAG: 3-hydroxyacyl-[acyl-carrier-protein] dehydratase FabZ [Caldisericota bacterium]